MLRYSYGAIFILLVVYISFSLLMAIIFSKQDNSGLELEKISKGQFISIDQEDVIVGSFKK